MAFLDNTGLAYFWSKVKTLLNGKLDSLNPNVNGNLNVNGQANLNLIASSSNMVFSPDGFNIYAENFVSGLTDIKIQANSRWTNKRGVYPELIFAQYVPDNTSHEQSLLIGSHWYDTSINKQHVIPIKLSGVDNGVMPYDAVNVQQLNEAISSAGSAEDKVSKTGDTMTGPLNVKANVDGNYPIYITVGGRSSGSIVFQSTESFGTNSPLGVGIVPELGVNPDDTSKRIIKKLRIGKIAQIRPGRPTDVWTIGGQLTLTGIANGTTDYDAVNFKQLTNAVNGFISTTGGTMTGPLVVEQGTADTLDQLYVSIGGEAVSARRGISLGKTNEDFVMMSRVDRGYYSSIDLFGKSSVGGGTFSSLVALENIYPGVSPTDAVNVNQLSQKQDKIVLKTITLLSTGWTNNVQTVSVIDISAAETAQVIQPIPAIANQATYVEAGIYASNQAENSLTFTCQTTPTTDLTVYVLIQNIA